MRYLSGVLAAACLATTVVAQQGGLTVEQILAPSPSSWPTYNGDYSGRRFSALARITDHNVQHLSLAWLYDLPGGGTIKATPLQVDGVLYFTIPDHAYAVEARTGRELWHYTWTRNRGGIHIGNRGVAVLGDSLYFVTPDCNLVALDVKTGKERWFKEYCSTEMVYYGSVAPVVVKDKLIVGVSGDDLDMPAYLDARNPKDGELIWRWYVTPQKAGDPGLDTWPSLDMAQHGGGMTWQPITYDSALSTIYVTTGNPQPVVAYKNREGANLYTASLVALDADTGKMKWHFQASPQDTHDWDATQTPVLIDGTVEGRPRKLVAMASRNGHFFVLDRTTGKNVVSSEYVKTNWSLGYDEKGQPIPNPAKKPQVAGALVTPNQGGATNWFSPSFSPQTGLFYVNATRAFSVWYIYDASDNPMGWGGTDRGGYAEQGQLKAIDYRTGKVRWSVPRYGGNSGLLSTAGNVVFGSGGNGLAAFNATTGEALWDSRIGNVTNGPITYELDGRQYVIAGAGGRLAAFVLNP
ncbi:Quinohemoprotein ethanol dehydrogenase type-1 precursor [Luteitalea pratensis]|uniref:Quinohemoprotein ethanol dehydrogenase type-1 n=1 Tax=Luteitalea pratensis TaxID=1855912 RepID=A0A143PTU7_LUTPR|nr:acido-empty-quinoprotein group A [Luteitalea pratensis]AMY11520.1 Quinohemoprotein ethanol dehydrogenase type-1 precursor [Luteitalea pratensis]